PVAFHHPPTPRPRHPTSIGAAWLRSAEPAGLADKDVRSAVLLHPWSFLLTFCSHYVLITLALDPQRVSICLLQCAGCIRGAGRAEAFASIRTARCWDRNAYSCSERLVATNQPVET